MSEIKAVLFDVGGVLALGKYSLPKFRRHPVGRSFHEYAARRLGLDMDTWFDSIGKIHDDANEGLISKKEALKKMAKNLGVSIDKLENAFYYAYGNAFVPNKKLMQVARDLRRNRYGIGILSDQWHLAREVFVEMFDLKRVFDPVIFSCDVKMKKPQPRIYKLALKKLGLKANEVVFIDNREWNLVPARKLGMKTVLFEGNRKCVRDLRKLGVEI